MVEEKIPAAVALGELGGRKCGKACAAKLTPDGRSKSTRKAAKDVGLRDGERNLHINETL